MSVVLDVSKVDPKSSHARAQPMMLARLFKRMRVSCIVIDTDDSPTRYEQWSANASWVFSLAFSETGVRKGIVLPSVPADATLEQRTKWLADMLHAAGQADYIEAPDRASAELLLSQSRDLLCRAPVSYHSLPRYKVLLVPEWKVLRVPQSEYDGLLFRQAVVGLDGAPWEQKPATGYGQRRDGYRRELEVALETVEGGHKALLEQRIQAAKTHTRLRLRLKLKEDATVDDKTLETLKKHADWIQAVGAPWDEPGTPYAKEGFYLTGSHYISRDEEAAQDIRVVSGAEVWVIGDKWPADGIQIPGLYEDNAHEVTLVRMIGSQEKITWTQGDEGLRINRPSRLPKVRPWVLEVHTQDTTP